MLVIRNWRPVFRLTWVVAAGTSLLCGCGAPGPRALLKGESLIKQHRYEAAIEYLTNATRLLPKNPQAWNHLGVAYHGAGQLDQAQRAYRQALQLDFNLAPARYNLGVLALEQNDALAAVEHLTSYTAFQPASVDGWIKLGNAQVRAHRLDQAEKSYKNAREVRPRDPEALNGLGNVAYHRRKATEALSFFNAALNENPKYAPAVLNTAVAHYSQNSRQQALQEFKQYTTIAVATPAVDAVYGVIEQVESEISASTARTNAAHPAVAARAPPTNPPPPIVSSTQRTGTPPPIVSAPRTNRIAREPPRTATVTNKPADVEVTQLEDDLVVKPAQDVAPGTRVSTNDAATSAQSQTSTNREDKKGLAGRSRTATPATNAQPILLAATRATNTPPAAPPRPNYPRYRYSSPALPKAGNRREAERYFAQGVTAQRSGGLAQAVSQYQQATQVDPAYFEAYHNLGLAAYELGKWSASLSAYEVALALKADSTDTRYNFALALKQAGYPLDAAEELKRILKSKPGETRAHLSLGNLYAYQLAEPTLAREHYRKVLETEPNHPKAGEIRYWLAANP
jgi:tetratricopeptide (TPR) repeat protein